MSLPQRLYQLYREVVACELVKSHQATPANMLQFQNLLNKAFPENEVETHQRALVRSMYNSSPVGFSNYVYQNRSRVGALVLWTESRCLAKFFRVNKLVHISFDEKTQQYAVVQYVPRQQRFNRTEQPSATQSATQSKRPVHPYTEQDTSAAGSSNVRSSTGFVRREHYFSRTPRILKRFNNRSRYTDATDLVNVTSRTPQTAQLETNQHQTSQPQTSQLESTTCTSCPAQTSESWSSIV